MTKPIHEMMGKGFKLPAAAIGAAILLVASSVHSASRDGKEPRLSEEPTKYLTEGDIPERPGLILELGDDFLGTGNLGHGFELPTGAVWTPSLWVFGTLRSAIQSVDTGVDGAGRTTEWVNRFDLFSNLQLTNTEKIILGIRPLDKNRPGQFSGYNFESDDDEGFQDFTNLNIRTFFAEGDFGSLFPALDTVGKRPIDLGFSVGRQPLILQDGTLLNDTLDGVGLVRNNIRLPGISNIRISGFWGFDSVSRGAAGVDLIEDNENAQLFNLSTSWDFPSTTINTDVVYVADNEGDDRDGLYGGLSAAQRFGRYNVTFRLNGSYAVEDESQLVTNGVLGSTEFSFSPHGTDDTVYLNPFLSLGTFTQAGQEPVDGGSPLGALGILFAGPNIGSLGSEIDSRANDVAGAAIGYQKFWNDNRTNLAVELAGRYDLGSEDEIQEGVNQAAIGFQAQQKILQQAFVQLEGYVAVQEDLDEAYGGRLELFYQF